jgi:nucleoside-diphosphate-sugar epimerase
MTSLVIGGGGLVGAGVVRLLLNRGEEQPVVFSRNPANSKAIGDVADHIRFVDGDLGNFSHVMDAVKKAKPKVIYHLGAMLPPPSEADPSSAMETNALGTYHVLEAARLFDIPQVLFSSSILVYWPGSQENVFDDYALERPLTLYGITKVFGEQLGLFYKRKYGLDFRGVRYPNVMGPGRPPGRATSLSRVIEECARGNTFTMPMKPETKLPSVYFKDAARAIVALGKAPLEEIKTVNYIVNGLIPTPSAGELADTIRDQIPGAPIDFQSDPELQGFIDGFFRPIDDSNARLVFD